MALPIAVRRKMADLLAAYEELENYADAYAQLQLRVAEVQAQRDELATARTATQDRINTLQQELKDFLNS